MFGLFGNKIPTLSMQDAQAELAKDRSIILLDVRTKEEYNNGHIKGSINVPLDRLPVSIAQKVPNKRAKLFVYCLSGSRSSQACSWLMKNGYENVTNIGGITAWPGVIVRG